MNEAMRSSRTLSMLGEQVLQSDGDTRRKPETSVGRALILHRGGFFFKDVTKNYSIIF